MQMKKENVVVKQNCHSRGMLSGIYNACRYYKKRKALLNECVEDPRLRLSGMTLNVMGFTLIELLVVVLIIGILTAVAVSQYKKAVYRSHYAKLKHLVSSFVNAQEVYYLANGKYAEKIANLDIDLPGGKNEDTSTDHKYQYDWGYCDVGMVSVKCKDNHTNMQYQVRLSHVSQPGRRECIVWNTQDLTDLRNQICKVETGATKGKATESAAGTEYTNWIYAK